jgi:hypothetical protein
VTELTSYVLNVCVDCGSRKALHPASVCEMCQRPRFTAMYNAYHNSRRVIAQERRVEQRKLAERHEQLTQSGLF